MFKNIIQNKKILIIISVSLMWTFILAGTGFEIYKHQKSKKEKVVISSSGDNSSYETMQKLLNGENIDKKEKDNQKLTLADVQKKYINIKSLYLETSITTKMSQNGKVSNENTEIQKFWYVAPNKMMLKSSVNEIYSDGKKIVVYTPAIKQYDTNPYKEEFFMTLILSSPAVNTLGMIKGFDYSTKIISYEYVGEEEFKGQKVDLIKLNLKMDGMGEGNSNTINQKIWLEKDSGIILRNYYKMSIDVAGNKLEVESDSKAISHKVNTDINKSVFVFVPKKDMNKFAPAKDAKRIEEEMRLFREMQENNPIDKKIADFKLLHYTLEEILPPVEHNTNIPSIPDLNANPEVKPEVTLDAPVNSETPETAIVTEPSNVENIPEIEKEITVPEKEISQPTYKLAKTELSFIKDISINKKTVVAFWAFPDDKNFLKSYQKFYEQNKDKYQIISVNINSDKDVEMVISEFKASGYTFPVYFMDKETGTEIIKNWMIMGIPAIYFVNQNSIMKDTLFTGNLDSITIRDKAISSLK